MNPHRLVLEYIPLGNLSTWQNISVKDCVIVLLQALSALSYLHGRKTPIVHRDLKPDNILVLSRTPAHIKLTDFGLSKASDQLVTFCGSQLYSAPEIHLHKAYTPRVDIWSLGVVILDLLQGLPSLDRTSKLLGIPWCQKIVATVDRCSSFPLMDILRNMICIDPRARFSATECYGQTEVLQATISASPTSYSSEDDDATVICSPEQSEASVSQTPQSSKSPTHNSSSSLGASQYLITTAIPAVGPLVAKRSMRASKSSSKRQKKYNPLLNSDWKGSSLDIFSKDWLQDSICVGSVVAAMGKESSVEKMSQWSSWSNEDDNEPVQQTPPIKGSELNGQLWSASERLLVEKVRQETSNGM